MTQEEIIRMALESGFSYEPSTNNIVAVDGYSECRVRAGLERFAALVAAHEREKQAEQEPVAYAVKSQGSVFSLVSSVSVAEEIVSMLRNDCPDTTFFALYAAPVHTKDLTDDEIEEIGKSYFDEWSFGFARAVIAADREKTK